MKIIADENMPFVRESFAHLGEVALVSGRGLTAEAVKDADVLLVRSVTKVGASLLEGSKVRFVGTATIGTDHVDTAYLKEKGIGFAAAPGSNATSVAEYVTAALLVLARRGKFKLRGKSIGIIGVGNVGSRVAAKAEALGMKVLLNDPPLAQQTGDARYLPISRIMRADFITLHVPLTMEPPDATYHMVNEEFVARMKPGACLINTSRGKVAEGRALKRGLDGDQISEVVLDVWENEPDPDPSLTERCAIATPHIAGYGYDGKVRGTEMLYRAVCAFFKAGCKWDIEHAMPQPEFPEIVLRTRGRDEEDLVREVALTVYDIEADDARMRKMINLSDDERPKYFDRLREAYPVRREFHNTRVVLKPERARLAARLRGLGFKVE